MKLEAASPNAQPGAIPARVLITDDDLNICNFCNRALTIAGYSTTMVHTADEALEALQAQGPFDLLLSDIEMPGVTGLELAERARQLDPAIAVVIMTAYTSMDNLHASVRRGVTDYLDKPFTIEVLRSAIDQALNKRHLMQERVRRQALEQLLRSSEAINALLDRDELAQVIVSRARDHVPCQAGFLILKGLNDTPGRVIAEPPDAQMLQAGRDAAVQSWRAGRAIAISGEQRMALLDDRQLTQGLAVPLRAQGEDLGALLLCDERPDLASPAALDTLSLLAHQAGNALHNAQLYSELATAYQSLQEFDRQKSEFIAIASHELRSPLSLVMGYAKMVRDRSEGEPREYAQQVLNGAERIRDIVDSMMHLRDIDRQETVLTLEVDALDDLARHTSELLASAAHQKQQHLDLILPATPLMLELDREKALLVIVNLVANAIKFTPTGGQIRVEVARWPHEALATAVAQATANPTMRRLTSDQPTEWAVVRVHDNGIGIPRDRQTRIFERFYQVASSLTREQGGVGLGLAIVCDLTTLQGGLVWVESEENRGSTFSFALPITP